MIVLVEIRVLCLRWLAYSLHAYLSSWLLACYHVMVSLCGFTLVFANLGIMMCIIA
jgi:hypothetical protein